jgi:hypothetical protein
MDKRANGQNPREIEYSLIQTDQEKAVNGFRRIGFIRLKRKTGFFVKGVSPPTRRATMKLNLKSIFFPTGKPCL